MTLEQRAQQFWSVLVFAAREQKVISYSTLAQITGFFDRPASVLRCIDCYCMQHHLPPLNSLVIDDITGQPGDECSGPLRDLSTHQLRVFVHDWLSSPAPSEEDFQHAADNEEELERAEAEYEALPC